MDPRVSVRGGVRSPSSLLLQVPRSGELKPANSAGGSGKREGVSRRERCARRPGAWFSPEDDPRAHTSGPDPPRAAEQPSVCQQQQQHPPWTDTQAAVRQVRIRTDRQDPTPGRGCQIWSRGGIWPQFGNPPHTLIHSGAGLPDWARFPRLNLATLAAAVPDWGGEI